MKNTTIIIPVHKLNGELEESLTIAINSIATQEEKPNEVLIVAKDSEDLLSELNLIVDRFKESGPNIKVIKNSGKTDYCSQVNLGVENITTKWFSILNFDDIFLQTWFKNFKKTEQIEPNADIIMPIIREANKEIDFIGFQNEAAWAPGYGDLGHLIYDTLLDYSNFSFDGAFIKTEKFKEIGGLKSNIVLSFAYEFLLRAATNKLNLFIVPKIGYVRINGVEGSLTDNYGKTLSKEEIKFWFKIAKQEHFYKENRTIDTSLLEKK